MKSVGEKLQFRSWLSYLIDQCDKNLWVATITIGYLWILIFFSHTAISGLSFISWIFIPSGIKLFIFMIFRWRASLGIFLGAFFINTHLHHLNSVQGFSIAALCTLTPLLALEFFERLKGYRVLESCLQWHHFIELAVIFAGINAVCHTYVFDLMHILPSHPLHPFKMAFGDFAGTIITLVIFIQIRKRLLVK